MLYFKNSELSNLYHISLGTVRNWIKAAADGKSALILHTIEGKQYVANTDANVALIEQLVVDNKKYRNTKASKVVTPRPEFYRLYNEAQIFDIITNLEIHHEIPDQYNYFGGGADNWDKYVHRLVSEDAPNQPASTSELFAQNRSYFDTLLARYKRVNIVDIGVGNAMPVKGLLTYLQEHGKLGRYIALDISTAMMTIAERNIKEWFDRKVLFQGYESDINRELFGNLLASESLGKDAKETVNLVLFLGGTPGNLRNPDGAFRNIHDSMGRNDLLVYTDKLDTEASRRYFDWNVEPGSEKLASNHRYIVDLLNIDDSFYDIEMGFDHEKKQRYVRIRLKVALTIKFNFATGEKLLEFSKGDAILLLRVWGVTVPDVLDRFDKNDFYPIHTTHTLDQQYIMVVSQVKSE